MSDKPINLFWTGGWDSTFRLLFLLIEEGKSVQPYFVVRPQDSVGYEIKTMNDIRRQLFRKYPKTRELLLPTIFRDVRSIGEKDEISESLKKLKENNEIATQYDFCARLCYQEGIYDMELSIHKDDKAHKLIARVKGEVFQGNADNLKQDEVYIRNVFKYFEYPIFDFTKIEMEKIAQKKHFDDLLEMTWFCATPYKGKPCGFCGPCTYVIDEGLSRRLPFFRRILSKIHMPARRFYRNRIKYGAKIEQRTGVKN